MSEYSKEKARDNYFKNEKKARKNLEKGAFKRFKS
jgi:hypothetical protein